jgi:cytochrome c oxidase subunit 2
MTPRLRRRAFLLGAAALALGLRTPATAGAPRVIQVRMRRFTFEPGEIHLARGETVTLAFTSLDVPMGFALPDFGLRRDVLPGLTSQLQLTPGKTGSFPFHCDLFCGSGHETMDGVIIVSQEAAPD